MFRAIVLIAAIVNGQPVEAPMSGHMLYKTEAACMAALKGDVTARGSEKKLVKDLADQGIEAVVEKSGCVKDDTGLPM